VGLDTEAQVVTVLEALDQTFGPLLDGTLRL